MTESYSKKFSFYKKNNAYFNTIRNISITFILKNTEKIISSGNVKVKFENNYKAYTSEIIYLKN